MRALIHHLRWILSTGLPLAFLSCDSKPNDEHSEYEEAKESLAAEGIQQGPVRHSKISDDLDARIRNFSAVFTEVYSLTHEEWLDGFKRDLNPENEVEIWEDMATAYSKFLKIHDVGPKGRNEAFGLLLVRSSTEDMQGSYSKLEVLTLEQAKAVVAGYEATAKPVTYQKAEQGGAGNPLLAE